MTNLAPALQLDAGAILFWETGDDAADERRFAHGLEWRNNEEALPAGERLRPDTELQRLWSRTERDARDHRLRAERRRSRATQSCAGGRRAHVPAAPRSGIPQGTQERSHRGRQAHSTQ